ncbi:MAG: hypothetical protein AAB316_11905, partial [Bacteroidota bacterium]
FRGENRFNLALGVLIEGKIRFDVETNNHDFRKVFETVGAAIYHFFEAYPHATLEIGAFNEQRLRVYNGIFRRRFHEIQPMFVVRGVSNGRKEIYDPSQFYEKFEVQRRKR